MSKRQKIEELLKQFHAAQSISARNAAEMGINQILRPNEDLSGLNLGGIHLGGNLSGVNFSECDLRGTNISNSILYNADFKNTVMDTGTKLTASRLSGAKNILSISSEREIDDVFVFCPKINGGIMILCQDGWLPPPMYVGMAVTPHMKLARVRSQALIYARIRFGIV